MLGKSKIERLEKPYWSRIVVKWKNINLKVHIIQKKSHKNEVCKFLEIHTD